MEQDWNKLIERYLQDELSHEGKEAFEFELAINPDLQTELDLHKLIHESVFRSVDRLAIQNIASKYHFQNKLKKWLLFTSIVAGLIVVIAALTLTSSTDPKANKNRSIASDKEDVSKVELTNLDLPVKSSVVYTNPQQFKEKAVKLKARTIPPIEEAPKTIQNLEHKKKTTEVSDAAHEEDEKQTNKRYVLPKGVNGLKELRVESALPISTGSFLSLGAYQVYPTPEGITFQNMSTGNSVFIRKAPKKNRKRNRRPKYRVFHVEGQSGVESGKIYKDVTQ